MFIVGVCCHIKRDMRSCSAGEFLRQMYEGYSRMAERPSRERALGRARRLVAQ